MNNKIKKIVKNTPVPDWERSIGIKEIIEFFIKTSLVITFLL